MPEEARGFRGGGRTMHMEPSINWYLSIAGPVQRMKANYEIDIKVQPVTNSTARVSI